MGDVNKVATWLAVLLAVLVVHQTINSRRIIWVLIVANVTAMYVYRTLLTHARYSASEESCVVYPYMHAQQETVPRRGRV